MSEAETEGPGPVEEEEVVVVHWHGLMVVAGLATDDIPI
jgi:hypothetical protein